MPLIISPKTTDEVVHTFREELNLKKISRSDTKFWHGNFQDAFYEGLNGLTKVLFTGYSGAVAGYSIIEYASQYLLNDKRPEIYFIGSVYAFRDSKLEPGDLVYAKDTFSPDSFEQSIYKNAKGRGVKDVTLPDDHLLERVLDIAQKKSLNFRPSKVHCCITPGYMPDFTRPMQLMDEGMWWKISLSKLQKDDCDSGEYESASVLACSRLFGIPAVALFDVKDKRYSRSEYRIASSEQKKKSLHSILEVIKESVQPVKTCT
jgi:purine-nucleoside phosphorylase